MTLTEFRKNEDGARDKIRFYEETIREADSIINSINKACEDEDRARSTAEKQTWKDQAFILDYSKRALEPLKAEEKRKMEKVKRGGGNGTVWQNSTATESTGYYNRSHENINIITPKDTKPEHQQVRLGDWLRLIADKNPRNEAEERALSVGTDTAGGYLAPEYLSPSIGAALVNYSSVLNAGAQIIPLEQFQGDTFKYTKVDTLPTISFFAEAATITTSDPVFGADTFTPKKGATRFLVSNELLQDGIDTAVKLEDICLAAAGEAIDEYALTGDGTGSNPLGLVNIAGLNSVSFGANGAAPTSFNELIDAKYEILNAKGDRDNLSVVWHPRTARDYAKLKDAQNQPLQMPKFIEGIRYFESQAISITETAGTGTDLSEAVMGNFRNLLIGMRLRPSVFVDPFSSSSTDQVSFRITFRMDIIAPRPVHFTLMSAIASA